MQIKLNASNRFVMLILISVLSQACAAPKQYIQPPQTKIRDCGGQALYVDNLNAIIGISTNECFTIDARNEGGTWLHVTLEQPRGRYTEGWIKYLPLSYKYNIDYLPIGELPTVRGEPATPPTYQTRVCLEKFPSVRIRSGPGTNYSVVGGIVRGDCFTVVGFDPTGTWVRSPELGGWVFAHCLNFADSEPYYCAITKPPDVHGPEPVNEPEDPGDAETTNPNGDYDCSNGPGDGPNYQYGLIWVGDYDPYGLDGDGDGWGCEWG